MKRDRGRADTDNGVAAARKDRRSTDAPNEPVAGVPVCTTPTRLVLWRNPILTLHYCALELALKTREYGQRVVQYRRTLLAIALFIGSLFALYHTKGPHQPFVRSFQRTLLWCSYWIGLGILSSVGLGTGLHTFILYLGPHIAAVTLAAFECMSVDFPEPPYPDEIVCPETAIPATAAVMTIWTIMSKVRLESFMWGAGTALGELPPYFMARASRLSSNEGEGDEEGLSCGGGSGAGDAAQGYVDRAKLVVQRLVHRVGFMGILLCASIPNPLFDLAGITCGHFLVPFWTFFGATLIGKAVFKMHIQKLFVIFVFSEHHVEQLIRLVGMIPRIGPSLQAPFKEYLAAQKLKMHRGRAGSGSGSPTDQGNWLGWFFEKIVIVMIVYFVVSIINSFAQGYHRRLMEAARKKADEGD